MKIVERIYFGEIDGSFFIIICFYLVGRVVIFVWGMKGSVYVFFMVGRFIGCYLLEIFGGDMVIGYDGGICVLIGVLIIIIIFFFYRVIVFFILIIFFLFKSFFMKISNS